MLRDLVKKAQGNDKEAMLKLVEQFVPLLRKYSRKLNYEDSYEEVTEEQAYYVQASCAREDTASLFLEFNTGNLLNQREQRVIHQIFVEGYTTAEIARLSHKSRQAVNQLKHRALKKLRDAWEGHSIPDRQFTSRHS